MLSIEVGGDGEVEKKAVNYAKHLLLHNCKNLTRSFKHSGLMTGV
ncbi:MAG: hypothetical protein ACRC06_01255 [Waterburya sp.]